MKQVGCNSNVSVGWITKWWEGERTYHFLVNSLFALPRIVLGEADVTAEDAQGLAPLEYAEQSGNQVRRKERDRNVQERGELERERGLGSARKSTLYSCSLCKSHLHRYTTPTPLYSPSRSPYLLSVHAQFLGLYRNADGHGSSSCSGAEKPSRSLIDSRGSAGVVSNSICRRLPVQAHEWGQSMDEG